VCVSTKKSKDNKSEAYRYYWNDVKNDAIKIGRVRVPFYCQIRSIEGNEFYNLKLGSRQK